MRRALAILLLAVLMCGRARAGVTIWQDPLYRSVIPDWTDLGTLTDPFKTIYCTGLDLAGAPVVPLTNTILSSFEITLTNVNPLNFTGSNYIGYFPQLLGFKLGTPILGGNPPTNEVEYLSYSTDGSHWLLVTNGVGNPQAQKTMGLMQPTYVAVVGQTGNSGTLQLYGLNQTNLWNRTNALYGQELQVGTPVNPGDAASKAYVDANAGTPSQWLSTVDTTNSTHLDYSFNGGALADFVSSSAWIAIDGVTADSTQTNLLLTIAQAHLFAGWHLLSQTNIVPLAQWQPWTNYICTTNAGEVTFKIPINFGWDAQYFLCQGTGTNWVNLNALTTIGGAFSLWVQTNTPTIFDLSYQAAARLWVSNGVLFVTGSTNGTTTYTLPWGGLTSFATSSIQGKTDGLPWLSYDDAGDVKIGDVNNNYSSVKLILTQAGALTFPGTITAYNFSGSIPATSLTGTVPMSALNVLALTNIATLSANTLAASNSLSFGPSGFAFQTNNGYFWITNVIFKATAAGADFGTNGYGDLYGPLTAHAEFTATGGFSATGIGAKSYSALTTGDYASDGYIYALGNGTTGGGLLHFYLGQVSGTNVANWAYNILNFIPPISTTYVEATNAITILSTAAIPTNAIIPWTGAATNWTHWVSNGVQTSICTNVNQGGFLSTYP